MDLRPKVRNYASPSSPSWQRAAAIPEINEGRIWRGIKKGLIRNFD